MTRNPFLTTINPWDVTPITRRKKLLILKLCLLFRHTVTEVFNLYQRTRYGDCVFHQIRIVLQNSFKKWDSCHTRLSVDKSMSHYWRAWMTLQVRGLSDIKVHEKQAYSSRGNRMFNWLLNATFFYITTVFNCQNMLRQCFQFKPNRMSETKQSSKSQKEEKGNSDKWNLGRENLVH